MAKTDEKISTIDVSLNPTKGLYREDFLTMAEMMVKAAKDPKVKAFMLTIDNPGAGKITMPFPLVDKKKK